MSTPKGYRHRNRTGSECQLSVSICWAVRGSCRTWAPRTRTDCSAGDSGCNCYDCNGRSLCSDSLCVGQDCCGDCYDCYGCYDWYGLSGWYGWYGLSQNSSDCFWSRACVHFYPLQRLVVSQRRLHCVRICGKCSDSRSVASDSMQLPLVLALVIKASDLEVVVKASRLCSAKLAR